MKKSKLSLILGLISIPAAALTLDTLLPYYLSMIVGELANSNYDEINKLIWIAAGLGLLGVGFNLTGFQALINHESAVNKSLRNATMRQLLRKDSSFFNNQKIGGLTGKFIDFINAHIGLQDLVIIQVLRFIMSFGTGIVIIFMNSYILGLFITGLFTLLILQIKLSLKLRSNLRHARKNMIAKINGAVADTVTNNSTVKTFGNEEYEEAKIEELSSQYMSIYRKDFRWMSIEGSSRWLISVIIQIVSIIMMVNLVKNGEISIGIAIFTITHLQILSSQLFKLGEMINGFDKVFLQAGPMTDILKEDVKIKDSPSAKELIIKNGAISLKDVVYKYEDSDILAINKLSLNIKGGQKIGLVGKSGAGKTTITKLLLRLDDTQEGLIEFDGQDIKSVTQTSLRQQIAYVPQEPILFHRTLRENIAYGNLNSTEDEIIESAKLANAWEFIEKLPNKLDTVVGERGAKLSGGQRQRVAIARAMLKNAPILILDEATSALDSESEKLIQSALERLMSGRTSIVVAHRLSTISKMDRIIVIEDGKIKEDGKHDSLVKKNGLYAKLWKHQSGGFIEE